MSLKDLPPYLQAEYATRRKRRWVIADWVGVVVWLGMTVVGVVTGLWVLAVGSACMAGACALAATS